MSRIVEWCIEIERIWYNSETSWMASIFRGDNRNHETVCHEDTLPLLLQEIERIFPLVESGLMMRGIKKINRKGAETK